MKLFDFGAALILILLLTGAGYTATKDPRGHFHGNPVPYINPNQ